MRLEYDAEDDAVPVKVVISVPRSRGGEFVNTTVFFRAPAPAPGAVVLVGTVPYTVKTTNSYIHPDAPELDWTEVILA